MNSPETLVSSERQKRCKKSSTNTDRKCLSLLMLTQSAISITASQKEL